MFEGYQLVDCIARIRDDILKIWNFYDPLKVSVYWYPGKRSFKIILQVLSGEEFSKRMLELVEPLAAVSDEVIQNQGWVASQMRIDVA